MRMRKTRVLTFLSLDWAIGSVLFSVSTSSFWPNFKICYARPYQHGKPSFPPFEVHLSAPRVTRKKVKGPLLLHSWPIDLIDLPFVFIRPEAKEKSYKERFFHAMHNGRASYGFLLINEWRGEYEEGRLSIFILKKEKGHYISYWIIWLNEEELFMWSHFTTIWNARNFDWWKPVHEDSPFYYVQFPSFGKHPVSQ